MQPSMSLAACLAESTPAPFGAPLIPQLPQVGILSPKIDLGMAADLHRRRNFQRSQALGRTSPARTYGRATEFTSLLAVKLLLMSMTVNAGLAANAADSPASLRAKVEKALPKSIGACVLVIDSGEVVFNEGFGRADVQSAEPCTPATNFRMASVSKQFTATAVLMLADRGKLSLDDTLDKFFPGGPKYWEKITVKHLLTHTSGIPDYEELVPEGTTLQLDDLDVVQMLMDAKAPLFAPEEKWQYSNSAFVLLGMIVEVAAKKPFHQFMADEIFAPLNMDDTLVFQRGLIEVKHRAFGYE